MEIIFLLKVIFAILLLASIVAFFGWLLNKVIKKDREKEAEYNSQIWLLKHFYVKALWDKYKQLKKKKQPSTQ